MTVVPSRFCKPGCTSLAMISTEPPAGAGATSVIIPEGQADCARAIAGMANAPARTARRVKWTIGLPKNVLSSALEFADDLLRKIYRTSTYVSIIGQNCRQRPKGRLC